MLLASFCGPHLQAQREGYNWCFGDTVGINFNSPNPSLIHPMNGTNKEAHSCISDSNGNLVAYTAFYPPVASNYPPMHVKNGNHQIVADTLIGSFSCTNGLLFLPAPQKPNEYYLLALEWPDASPCGFNACQTLYFHHFDFGNPQQPLVSKDNILLNTEYLGEKIGATRHSNGEDWWIVVHSFPANTLITFLLTESGFSAPIYHPFPVYDSIPYWSPLGSLGEICFNRQGDQLVYVLREGWVHAVDFDNCTGVFSNMRTRFFTTRFYGCSISPNSDFVYASSVSDGLPYDNLLLQLNSSDLSLSDTLAILPMGWPGFGQHQLGPDGRIYIANPGPSYSWGTYPYSNYNMHLGVIEYPDSAGAACAFDRFGYYLGGKKNFYGLPNIPQFEKPTQSVPIADAGQDQSGCPDAFLTLGNPLNFNPDWTYQWTPTLGLSDPTSPTPVVDVSQIDNADSMIYYVQVTDPTIHSSCAHAWDSSIISLMPCLLDMEIPNVITPNGDGINDSFFISNLPSNLSLKIFDRWGKVVFSQNSYQNNWDGSHVPEGVYYYIIEYFDNQKGIFDRMTGNFTLIR